MVISFLVLWSICLSSSLVHLFKFFSGPLQEWSRVSYEGNSLGIYLFDKVPAIEFCLEQFSGSSEILFLFFYFISACLMVSASNIPSICRFHFLLIFWWLLDLVVRLLPSCVICHFSLLAWRIFLSQIPFLYLDCIFSLFVLGFPVLFRLWQKVWCRPCTTSGWFFFYDFIIIEIISWNDITVYPLSASDRNTWYIIGNK